MVSTADRKEKIGADVQGHLARRSEMKVHAKDEASEKIITIEFKDGKPLVIVTAKYQGVTPAGWAWFHEGLMENVTKVDKNNQMTLLEDNGDHKVVHQRIITPAIASNRSMIMTMWSDVDLDGKSIWRATSVGNEELEKKYADKIGKDVVAIAYATW